MDLSELRKAALDFDCVAGLTHDFYRYPARFSPTFAAAAIELFSEPGQLILDPYMGGGTTVVEALASGRRAIGSDINSLSVFVARVKTTPIPTKDVQILQRWLKAQVSRMSYRLPRSRLDAMLDDCRARNLTLPRARAIKKAIAFALASIDELPNRRTRDFARCLILRTSQWALDNRKRSASLDAFRDRLASNAEEMVLALAQFSRARRRHRLGCRARVLLESDAGMIHQAPIFAEPASKVDLVVASPPYPGVHVLYHRWQVDGRRETPAPYWIADCQDGQGTSFYTFGDRRRANLDYYFECLLKALKSIRRVLKPGGYMIQMIGFSQRSRDLRRYLRCMEESGFIEIRPEDAGGKRIWRDVPNRKWHATFKGHLSTSREVVLVHRTA